MLTIQQELQIGFPGAHVDYPIIGHPDGTKCTRVTDNVPDASGVLRMGIWRGAFKFDSAVDGAAQYDSQIGQWQRFPITNTGNFGDFNRELSTREVDDV